MDLFIIFDSWVSLCSLEDNYVYDELDSEDAAPTAKSESSTSNLFLIRKHVLELHISAVASFVRY